VGTGADTGLGRRRVFSDLRDGRRVENAAHGPPRLFAPRAIGVPSIRPTGPPKGVARLLRARRAHDSWFASDRGACARPARMRHRIYIETAASAGPRRRRCWGGRSAGDAPGSFDASDAVLQACAAAARGPTSRSTSCRRRAGNAEAAAPSRAASAILPSTPSTRSTVRHRRRQRRHTPRASRGRVPARPTNPIFIYDPRREATLLHASPVLHETGTS